MISDSKGSELHHKAVLGEPLSESDRQSLAAWYERLDQEEAETLTRTDSESLDILKTKVNDSLLRLGQTTEALRLAIIETEKMRQDNLQLRLRIGAESQTA